LAGFAQAVADDDQGGERVGPPRTGDRVQREAEQHGGGQQRVDERDAPLGGQH